MRLVTEAQLKNIERQATDFMNSLNWEAFCDDTFSNGGIALMEISEATAKNLFAKALGYTDWNHVATAEKDTTSHNEEITVFEDLERGYAFVSEELGIPVVTAKSLVESLSKPKSDDMDTDTNDYQVPNVIDATLTNPEALEGSLLEYFDHLYTEDVTESDHLSLTRSESAVYLYTRWLVKKEAPELSVDADKTFDKHISVLFDAIEKLAKEGKLAVVSGNLFQDACDYYGSIKGLGNIPADYLL
ncbi:hypothetical protein [Vibrio crassostreae]|uniref:hypothetical protein n=1 Tax=Vibrio crassostreae TaxID=246167 RepID=UPI001B30F4C9|nr:hypothetical protein [Vibrio crassostreae]